MRKKVQKVTLEEFEIVEVEGKFEKRFINQKNYPACLTNAAVKRGFESFKPSKRLSIF